MNRTEILEAMARAMYERGDMLTQGWMEWSPQTREHYMHQAEAALSALEALGMVVVPRVATEEWLPIESAPKTGVCFLACSPASSVYLAHWANGVVDSSSWTEEAGYQSRYATHWRPLPSPPQTKDTGHE